MDSVLDGGGKLNTGNLDSLYEYALSTGDVKLITKIEALRRKDYLLNGTGEPYLDENGDPELDDNGDPIINRGFLEQSVAEQEAKINSLKAKGADMTDWDRAKLKVYEDAMKGMEDRGISYGGDRGWYEFTSLVDVSPGDWNIVIEERIKQQSEYKLRTGRDVPLFTPEELKLINDNITDNPPLLKEFIQGLGPQAKSVLKEMGIDNPIVAQAGALYLNGDLEVADSLFIGQTIVDELKQDTAWPDINTLAIEMTSGVYGLNAEHERTIRDAALARAAYLAKIDGKALDKDNFEKYYKLALGDVAPPIVTLDSDNIDGQEYNITSPNPEWPPEVAQERTEDWIEGLDATDFEGVEPALMDKILENIDTTGDYGFSEYKLVPYQGGYLIRQFFPPGFVVNEDGSKFVLRYIDKSKESPAFQGQED